MSLDLPVEVPTRDDRQSIAGVHSGDLLTPGDGAPVANAGDSRVGGQVRVLIRRVLRILTFPIRGYLSLRRSMTVASVMVMLGAFMTLNVIWGFPWSGMMGACLAVLAVGFTISRVMTPRLKLSVSLPRSAIAGHPFSVNVRLLNSRYMPALNLRVGWHREGLRDIYDRKMDYEWDASPPVSVDLLRGGEQMQWHGAMQIRSRGVHELPPFQVVSDFPFHLFHNRKAIETSTKIAVTPAPASPEDDPTTRAMLSQVGDWAKQLVVGAPVEYVGNREYQEGVPVRRWDFASWARLGRPIVREYQSPSIHAVTLVIDTSQDPDASITRDGKTLSAKQQRREAADRFEHLLSIAATAIADITRRRIQLSIYLTCEPVSEVPVRRFTSRQNEGNERLLVRLASASPVDPALGEQRLREAFDSNRSEPTLVLSLIDLDDGQRRELAADLPPHVNYLPIKDRTRSDQRVGGSHDR